MTLTSPAFNRKCNLKSEFDGRLALPLCTERPGVQVPGVRGRTPACHDPVLTGSAPGGTLPAER